MGNEHYYHTFLKVVILAVLLVFSIVSLAVFVRVSRSLASLVRSYMGGVGVTVALASAMISLYVHGNVFYYSCFKGTILATKRRFIAVCPHVDSKVCFTSCFTSINSYSYLDRVHFVDKVYKL